MLDIDLGEMRWLGLATAPNARDEAPVRVHPITARLGRDDTGIDALVAIAPPGRGIDHPALRQLGDSAARYLRARRWWRRWYLTRQLAYALLVAGVVVAMPVLALASGDASAQLANTEARGPDVGALGRTAPVAAGVAKHDGAPRAAPRPAAPAPQAPQPAGFTGEWVDGIQGLWFVPYPADPDTPFLACTRSHESDTAGGYNAIDPAYRHFGAYQFLQSTWNNVARKTGRTWLIGVNPAYASHRDQDWMALYLYRWQGASHWQGRCAGT